MPSLESLKRDITDAGATLLPYKEVPPLPNHKIIPREKIDEMLPYCKDLVITADNIAPLKQALTVIIAREEYAIRDSFWSSEKLRHHTNIMTATTKMHAIEQYELTQRLSIEKAAAIVAARDARGDITPENLLALRQELTASQAEARRATERADAIALERDARPDMTTAALDDERRRAVEALTASQAETRLATERAETLVRERAPITLTALEEERRLAAVTLTASQTETRLATERADALARDRASITPSALAAKEEALTIARQQAASIPLLQQELRATQEKNLLATKAKEDAEGRLSKLLSNPTVAELARRIRFT